MKVENRWVLPLACLLLGTLVGCDPCSGAIYADSASEVGALANCEVITGDLTLGGGGELTDLDSLANLTSVDGDLDIIKTSLTNVDGLSNITTVSGSLFIRDNNALSNVDGLAGLTSVGGDVHLYFNAVLSNLDGLANLTTIGGDVLIHDHPDLCRSLVEAFIAAGSIGGSVNTYGNGNGC